MDAVIQDLIRKQRPYYLPQGNPIKGVEKQYWLIFRYRDLDKPENLLTGLASMLGFKDKNKPPSHRILRIDLDTAKVYTYLPRQDGDIPTTALLRTAIPKVVERFLNLESSHKESALLEGSFREVRGIKRRYSLPENIAPYDKVISQLLERSVTYRRSTAYFDSGVLKLYEEPLQKIIQTDGRIRLLMDWQGFTKRADVAELERLHKPDYRAQFAQRTLQEFLQGLDDNAFTSTQMLAELVRLEFLQIRLVKMQQGRAIYHKKTGIFSDRMENHVQHEGSDNFTRAAHSRNAESVTFLFSWERLDHETVTESIQEFDAEWERDDLTFDLSQDFLRQVLEERDRRAKLKQPTIDTVTPNELPPGETTEVTITGENLDQVDQIEVADNELVDINITDKQPDHLKADVTISPDHPPREVGDFIVSTTTGTYTVPPAKPPQIPSTQPLPEYAEIEGFQQAIELIQSGLYGTPNDFLYWCAQQRPRQFRIEQSDTLDQLVNDGILFEHQKSGAQHCLRVMEDFGVVVCADAVGLGKTRLAAAVSRLYRQNEGQAKIAIIAARKLHDNWEREMAELGFRGNEYELYNKNLMSRKGNGFIENFNRYGGPDLVIIDEAHEGIRNYKNRIHKMCLQIREQDQQNNRQRHFLLLTATPWNNRREDIYNLLSPFLTRPEGFTELDFPPVVAQWFQSREHGVESFTDDDKWFRRTYRELFLQRTRQMLREAMPNLAVYAKRQAEWLPVEFEDSTEQALEQIFTQFETQLYIPFADPVRYLRGDEEQRSLLQNQRRFFLQRAESSMYALKRTIENFRGRIQQMKDRLSQVEPTAEGLKAFLFEHYGFNTEEPNQGDLFDFSDREAWDEDWMEEDEEEDEDEEPDTEKAEKRQQLRRTIELAVERLQDNPLEARRVYDHMWSACDCDLLQLDDIQSLLADEFVKDHKREKVTSQVRELVAQGHKVLLISTFSDTVIDYYRYMGQDPTIQQKGIGMAIGSTKAYFPADSDSYVRVSPHNLLRGRQEYKGLKRQQLFRLFAPVATCRNPGDRPRPEEEINVLIGSETLSVGQNLQDADYLINIDLPWNPMTLEQRIGRIDRPKQRPTEYIHIYYANSQSQLLRQASRLSNLNKKLVGSDLVTADQGIEQLTSLDKLGASIYGDTLFDDTILPGYIEFLESLTQARRMEQESFQEKIYQQQETRQDLYSQQELLFSEDISQQLKALGDDYLPNPIALGSQTGDDQDPASLVALAIQYFGPNGEAIPSRQEQVFWNDQTGERDGFGMAIATAFKTPQVSTVLSSSKLLTHADTLYQQLIDLKRQRAEQLEGEETLENVTITSARLNRIQQRLGSFSQFPEGIDPKVVRASLKKLNSWKNLPGVQKLLRAYTDGDKATLADTDFVTQLVADTDSLNLLGSDEIKAVSLRVSLSALLLRV